jgi:hypothetical protein
VNFGEKFGVMRELFDSVYRRFKKIVVLTKMASPIKDVRKMILAAHTQRDTPQKPSWIRTLFGLPLSKLLKPLSSMLNNSSVGTIGTYP